MHQQHAAALGLAAQVEEQAARRPLGLALLHGEIEHGALVLAAAGAVPAQAGAFQAPLEPLPQALQLEAVGAAEQLQRPGVGEAHAPLRVQGHDAGAEQPREIVARRAGLRGFQRILGGIHVSFSIRRRDRGRRRGGYL